MKFHAPSPLSWLAAGLLFLIGIGVVSAAGPFTPPTWTVVKPGTAGGTAAGPLAVTIRQGFNGLTQIYLGSTFTYTVLYAIVLAVAIAWGQAGANTLPNFILGSIIVIGGSSFAALYLFLFPGVPGYIPTK